MRQTHLALPSFGSSPHSESLCRLLPAPAASGSFPILFCNSFPRCLVPCPTVPSSAPTCLFLDVSGLPQDTMGQLPVRSANAIFRGLVFEVADISLCPGLCVCVVSQIAPTAASFPTGQPRLLRPGISCFVTSARSGYAIRPIQVIDGKGTFTFPDLQPCRLLQCQNCIPGRFTLNNPRNVVVSPRNCPGFEVVCFCHPRCKRQSIIVGRAA